MAFRQKVQSKALKNLKLIILVFSLVQVYCLIYAAVMFAAHGSCEYPSNSVALGVFIWTLTRTVEYLVWVYPIMFIFWPKSLQTFLVKKCKCCCPNAQKAKERETGKDSEYNDFDHVDSGEDELYAEDWLNDDESENGANKKSKSALDQDEDEWTQTNRRRNASEVYFLGSQPVKNEIAPQSDLVRRSILIAKNQGSVNLEQRMSLIESHEASIQEETVYRNLINHSLVDNDPLSPVSARSVSADNFFREVGPNIAKDTDEKKNIFDDEENEQNSFIDDSPLYSQKSPMRSSSDADSAHNPSDIAVYNNSHRPSYVDVAHPCVNGKHVHLKTPQGSRAKLVRHTFTSMQDTQAMLDTPE